MDYIITITNIKTEKSVTFTFQGDSDTMKDFVDHILEFTNDTQITLATDRKGVK